MAKRYYCLPDKTETTNVRTYIDQWRALGAAVARILGPGWRCTAFDPGLVLSHPRESYIDVDVRLAFAIRNLSANRKE